MSDDDPEPGEESADEEPVEPTEREVAPGEKRAPLSDLRDRVEGRGQGRIDSERDVDVEEESPLSELARDAQTSDEADSSELFEEVDVGDVDAEAVWETVVEEGEPPEEVLGEGPEAGAARPAGAADEHVINKREYCQRCEYFSEPPDVACGHEGTDILEMPDGDRFRVRNCPKVIESEEELSSVIEE